MAVFVRRDMQPQVGQRQQRAGLVWPLGELEPGLCEHVAQAGIDPFMRVVEAVEVEVRGLQPR
jgi:hypothetical protein